MFSVRPRRTYKGGSRAIQEVADLVDKQLVARMSHFFVAHRRSRQIIVLRVEA